MYIQAVMKCEKDNTPYRIYLNDELITERYYSLDESVISNNLELHITESPEYNLEIQSLTDVSVELIDYSVTEEKP
jgi:hypothetical protein|tara:strand:- start:229 stop:456 length:228 start_codon:yes stop_codon:yes gene_type:complete